jgi:hypothetical protein
MLMSKHINIDVVKNESLILKFSGHVVGLGYSVGLVESVCGNSLESMYVDMNKMIVGCFPIG